MKKDIYKITNLVNGKVYIGQSKNCKRRFKEHISAYSSSYSSKIHNAIMKYGIHNFKFEILEHNVENYNEREKWWIDYYKSNKREFGYNITEGGEDPPVISGDDSYFAIYSEEQINKVINEILQTNKPFEQIAKENNLSTEYLSFLNRGIIRKDDRYKYPLRINGNEIVKENIVNSIEQDLSDTFLSFADIQRKYNVSANVVYDVNNGRHSNCSNKYSYPIREKYAQSSQEGFGILVNMLKDSKYKRDEIAQILGVSKIFISRFNNGKIYKQNNIDYPIRKSSQRVY